MNDLTTREAAVLMCVTPATINRHVRLGTIPREDGKISRHWVEDYIARQNLPLCSTCRRYKVLNPGETMCDVCEERRLDGMHE